MSTSEITAVPERKWAMNRLGKGDYLLASNDLAVLWRIHSYEDGAYYGIVDCPFESRTFWRACWLPMDEAKRLISIGELPDPWDSTITGSRFVWHEADWNLPTRSAAIECAMKHDARRAADV